MTTESLEKLGKLERYTKVAIRDGYLLGILVTSQAQASLPSEGWSFGAGKTTFALKWAKNMCYNGNFEQVKEHTICFAEQLDPFFDPDTPTTPCVVIEDMQFDFGKHRSRDRDIQELGALFTMQRPQVNVIIGTAPHRGQLAKYFREELFHFEVIIPERGLYEIQRLRRWIDFKDPVNVKETIDPAGVMGFLDLNPKEKEWYLEWRNWRDKEAKSRVRIFQKRQQRLEHKPVTHREFKARYRELGLRGDDAKIQELFRWMSEHNGNTTTHDIL